MKRETRTQRSKREVRGRILAAAAELFDDFGVEATKVESICDQADIALRTFFNHFPSKRDVVHQLAVDATDVVAARVREAHAAAGSTGERLERFFADSAEASIQGGPMHRELLAALIAVPVGAENLQGPRDAMIDLLRDGAAAGELVSGHSIETLADVVIGAFYRIVIDFAIQDDYPIRERLEQTCRFLRDAIARE
jgi:AcrR family transcriptional regulator